MYRSFTVKNFRCFRDLTLEPLERVNLIAGKNNTGKTALLEAIHLHSYPHDCELPFLINERRGTHSEKKYEDEICEWLFFDDQADAAVELQSRGDHDKTHTLRLWLLDPSAAVKRFPKLADAPQHMPRSPFVGGGRWLILQTVSDGEELPFAILEAQSGGLASGYSSLGCNKAPWNGPSIFIGSAGRSSMEDAVAFSSLELANRQEEILPSLRILEPRLQRLSILLLAEKPVIHGRIDGLSRLVPVQFMGEGIRRLLSILLAINEARGGNVLIDEVENGLHYSVMVHVWQAIALAARTADVQIFATTHSYECIQAAQQSFSAAQPYELRLFRLDRIDDGIHVAVYKQNTLNTAIEMNLEVR
jgi:AAA15 family ATPase/GTPase